MNKCQICGSKENISVMDNNAVCWNCLKIAFKQYMKKHNKNIEFKEEE